MNTPNDGGQLPGTVFTETETLGIGLRDYFAGQALAGMMEQGFIPNQVSQASQQVWNYAKAAYDMADAMLTERAKRQ